MHDEDDFLRKLSETPADDTVRLVYADWLDERGDAESQAKAKFLRLTVGPVESGRKAGQKRRWKTELQSLAVKLPTDWLAVVSRLKVEGCGTKRAEYRQKHPRILMSVETLFEFVCDRRWDEMTPTEDPSVRHCEQCKHNVHYCDTLAVARQHAEKAHCIVVDLGVLRRPNDLSPPQYWAGRPSAEMLRKEEDRRQLDAVSQEREERKRQQNAEGNSST